LAPYEAERVEVPRERLPLVVHGGEPVSTREALARLEACIQAGHPGLESVLGRVRDSAERLADALVSRAGSGDELILGVRDSADALRLLSDALGIGGGSGAAMLARASSIAEEHGGAAKQSGAGGGDLVLVFVPEAGEEERAHVAARLDKAGLHVLDVALDETGVRTRSSPQVGSRLPGRD
jgi:phosphomevalonate kinase